MKRALTFACLFWCLGGAAQDQHFFVGAGFSVSTVSVSSSTPLSQSYSFDPGPGFMVQGGLSRQLGTGNWELSVPVSLEYRQHIVRSTFDLVDLTGIRISREEDWVQVHFLASAGGLLRYQFSNTGLLAGMGLVAEYRVASADVYDISDAVDQTVFINRQFRPLQLGAQAQVGYRKGRWGLFLTYNNGLLSRLKSSDTVIREIPQTITTSFSFRLSPVTENGE